MYGKHFASMYEGSMVGMGPTVFAVWGYCIAKADPEDHTVLLNPTLLSGIIGTTNEDITQAIQRLTEPDPKSKNQDHQGRRLLYQAGFSYFVVSHEHYRNMKNMDDVREYERLRKRKQRQNVVVPECPGQCGTPASVSVSVSGISSEGVQGESGSTANAPAHALQEPVLSFTLEQCLSAAEGLAMKRNMVEAFFQHYAAVNFVDAAGRPIVSLKHALAKWKKRQAERDAAEDEKNPYAKYAREGQEQGGGE